MKTLLKIMVILAVMAAPAMACEPNDPDPACCDVQQQAMAQQQQQGQAQGQVAAASASAPTTISTTYKSETRERARFNPVTPSHVTIGEVSKPVMQWGAYYQHDEDAITGERNDSVQIGLSGPILFSKTADKSLETEAQRLRDRNLHVRESHQADMALVCMELHQMMKRTQSSISQELWDRCASYEHFNNDATMKVLENRFGTRHKSPDEMDPDKFSPHSEPYQK